MEEQIKELEAKLLEAEARASKLKAIIDSLIMSPLKSNQI